MNFITGGWVRGSLDISGPATVERRVEVAGSIRRFLDFLFGAGERERSEPISGGMGLGRWRGHGMDCSIFGFFVWGWGEELAERTHFGPGWGLVDAMRTGSIRRFW